MSDKTQKIREAIHKTLKQLALDEGKSLQEVTEEVIKDGLKNRGIEVGARTGQGSRGREGGENDQGGTSA